MAKISSAEENFKKAIACPEGNEQAKNNFYLGLSHYHKNDSSNGFNHIEAALKIMPIIARSYLRKKTNYEWDEAIDDIKNILFKRNAIDQQYFNAVIKLFVGDKDDAISDLKKI